MKPLAGLQVLELARILAGPWVGQLLADLGADVVKVESPEGDDTRRWGPPFVAGRDGTELSAAYFHSCNRGKRSIVADFREPEGQALVRRLAGQADVLVENFKLGGLVKYGLDSASLRAAFPRLVYCSITGFGQTGPYADRAGYDFLIQGMAGAMDLTGSPDGPPTKAGYATADILTGLYASVGILAALRRRDATGQGAHIDLALMDAQVAALANQPLNYLVSGVSPVRLGNAHPNIVPYEVFPVADGAIVIATGNDRQFRDLCQAIEAPDLAAHADYRSNADRVRHRARLAPELARRTARLPRAELLARLEARKVPAGPVNTLADVFADPQVQARHLKIDLTCDAALAGSIPSVRSPIVIDGEPMVSPRASPLLGADTADILNDPQWGA